MKSQCLPEYTVASTKMPLEIQDHKGLLGQLAPGLPGKDAVPAVLGVANSFLH